MAPRDSGPEGYGWMGATEARSARVDAAMVSNLMAQGYGSPVSPQDG
ncbi:MAG: hypothetical protein QOE29_408 [Gaiellaceae bacterium]|nr:hypothetical protein [Gaiellaceae bacterium]